METNVLNAVVIATGDDEVTEQEMLDKVRLLTQMLREHQSAVVRLGKQRRRIIRKLRERRVPYRDIAEVCGVTDQAIFADLRKHPED
jgi:DNA-directed RNA polymerase specialized sigma24 family protein